MDTSAWIEFFHEPRSPWGDAVDLLLGEGRVCTTSLVMVEVVSGAKNHAEYERLRKDFRALPQVEPPQTLWEEMMALRWRLKTKGIAGVSIPDLIIAQTAYAHQKVILTRDRDFSRLRRVLDIRLLEPA